jgi:hypothetical protein
MSTLTPEQYASAMKAAAKEVASPTDLLTRIAILVEGAVKRNTPVLTGNLRRSITHRVEGHAAYVGTAVVYAKFVDDKQHYMQAGLDQSQSQIKQLVEDFGGKVAQKAAGH